MEKKVVSFGCMCSTAIFLREKGYRDISSFFDWVDSNLIDNIRLVNGDFEDILKPDLLQQLYSEYPHIVTNVKYSLSFAHLFDPKMTFSAQKRKLSKKCQKLISNFMEILLSGKAILVYYLRLKEECNIIDDNQSMIESFLNKYNAELLIISNFPCQYSFAKTFFVEANNIHIPFGGPVSFPFEKTNDIENYLDSVVSLERRKNNIAFCKKNNKPRFTKRVKSFLNRFKRNKLRL